MQAKNPKKSRKNFLKNLSKKPDFKSFVQDWNKAHFSADLLDNINYADYVLYYGTSLDKNSVIERKRSYLRKIRVFINRFIEILNIFLMSK